jgi:hypothetical protein
VGNTGVGSGVDVIGEHDSTAVNNIKGRIITKGNLMN